MRRRTFLTAVGLGAAGYAAWQAASRIWTPSFEFEPIPHLPGFRRLAAGEVSRGRSPFVGLENVDAPEGASTQHQAASDLCAELFGDMTRSDGVVRLAYFSDFNCPICRVMSEDLVRLDVAMDGVVRVIWRELPLLGEQSVLAARAAIAAGRQGAYVAAHRRLMRSRFQVTPAYLRSLADGLGLEWVEFQADFESAATLEEIARSLKAASLLGFYGTPGIVIERTAALGYLDVAQVTALIALERNEADDAPCD